MPLVDIVPKVDPPELGSSTRTQAPTLPISRAVFSRERTDNLVRRQWRDFAVNPEERSKEAVIAGTTFSKFVEHAILFLKGPLDTPLKPSRRLPKFFNWFAKKPIPIPTPPIKAFVLPEIKIQTNSLAFEQLNSAKSETVDGCDDEYSRLPSRQSVDKSLTPELAKLYSDVFNSLM